MLPFGITLSFFLLIIGGRGLSLIPVAIWIVIFCFLVNSKSPKRPLSSRLFGFLFGNPVALYLGKISYSIYLSHYLVIIVTQSLVLKFLPEIERTPHLYVMLLLTVIASVVLSHFLFSYLESPGIKLGAHLVNRFLKK